MGGGLANAAALPVTILSGTVIMFAPEKGFGFIRDSSGRQTLCFRQQDCDSELIELLRARQRPRVKFKVKPNSKLKLRGIQPSYVRAWTIVRICDERTIKIRQNPEEKINEQKDLDNQVLHQGSDENGWTKVQRKKNKNQLGKVVEDDSGFATSEERSLIGEEKGNRGWSQQNEVGTDGTFQVSSSNTPLVGKYTVSSESHGHRTGGASGAYQTLHSTSPMLIDMQTCGKGKEGVKNEELKGNRGGEERKGKRGWSQQDEVGTNGTFQVSGSNTPRSGKYNALGEPQCRRTGEASGAYQTLQPTSSLPSKEREYGKVRGMEACGKENMSVEEVNCGRRKSQQVGVGTVSAFQTSSPRTQKAGKRCKQGGSQHEGIGTKSAFQASCPVVTGPGGKEDKGSGTSNGGSRLFS